MLHRECENLTWSLKDVVKALLVMLELKEHFKERNVVECLRNLAVESYSTKKLSILFMRSILDALSAYPHSIVEIIKILRDLVKENANEDDYLYSNQRSLEGLTICCKKIFPHSITILELLPKKCVHIILYIRPELEEIFMKYVDDKKYTKVISISLVDTVKNYDRSRVEAEQCARTIVSEIINFCSKTLE